MDPIYILFILITQVKNRDSTLIGMKIENRADKGNENIGYAAEGHLYSQ